MGIGIMTEQRWKATYDMMVKEDLLAKDTDWTKGFTTQFVKDLKISWQ
jgi:NitT/TauT family transport system substrate-binding protein